MREFFREFLSRQNVLGQFFGQFLSRNNFFLKEFLILAKDFFSKKFFGEFLSREFHSFHEDLTKRLGAGGGEGRWGEGRGGGEQ